MQVAAVFDSGRAGREFIKGLNEKEQVFTGIDNEFGAAIWEFDDLEEAKKVALKLFERVGVADIVRAFFVGDDNEDMRAFLPF
jgi:phosphoglycolate phosphatase-like HAD superfamily hydrolase